MEAMSKSASGWAMLSRMEHNSNNVRELSLFPDDDTESEERQEVWRKRSIPTHSEWLYPLTFDAGKGLKEA